MKPPKSLLDKSFAYTPSTAHEGDPLYLLRKFRRILRERKQNESEAAQKVAAIPQRRASK